MCLLHFTRMTWQNDCSCPRACQKIWNDLRFNSSRLSAEVCTPTAWRVCLKTWTFPRRFRKRFRNIVLPDQGQFLLQPKTHVRLLTTGFGPPTHPLRLPSQNKDSGNMFTDFYDRNILEDVSRGTRIGQRSSCTISSRSQRTSRSIAQATK